VSNTTLGRLQAVQNSAFRRIHHLPLRTPITELTKISQMMEAKDRLRYLGFRYIVKAMRINPLIQQTIVKLMHTISWINAKNKWFTGTPFAISLPLIVMAKATVIYIAFTYMLEMSTNVACRGLSRGKLRAYLLSLGPLIYSTSQNKVIHFSKQNNNKITTKSQQNHNKISTKSQQNHNKISTVLFCCDFVVF